MDKPANPPVTGPRVTARVGASAAQLPPGLDARSAAVLREIVEQYVRRRASRSAAAHRRAYCR